MISWSMLQTIVVGVPYAAIGALLLGLMQGYRPFKKMQHDRELGEVTRLVAEVADLRNRLDQHQAESAKERQRLEDKIEAQRVSYEGRIEMDRVKYDSERRAMAHVIRNGNGCFDTLIIILDGEEGLSAKAQRALVALKDMRARQQQEEATEKGAMFGAAFLAVARPQEQMP